MLREDGQPQRGLRRRCVMPHRDSLVRRAVVAYGTRNRNRKAEMIRRHIETYGVRTVALVGVGGTVEIGNARVVEHVIERHATVVAALDIWEIKAPWPYVRGDGRKMPFRSSAVDLIVSNAVIEHVGDEADQRAFVTEHLRAARTSVITTPNRWFPVESHTSQLLKHWSPRWRSQRSEFTRLLSRSEFAALLPLDTPISGRWWSPTFVAFVSSGSKPSSPY